MAKEQQGLLANLQNYQVQLQQVEAALLTEPGNEELLKLKSDLEEVINLTDELLSAGKDESSASTSQSPPVPDAEVKKKWKSGEMCFAPWSQNGQYYEARIEEILDDGTCSLTFTIYENSLDVAQLSDLRPLDKKRVMDVPETSKSKKQMLQAQREYKKKKALKKATRQKQVEEDREKEKNKWQSFNAKAFSKNHKGQVKKSIFATPDNVNGRVGVGTCGIGGRPMTEFHQAEKWRKPMSHPHPFEG